MKTTMLQWCQFHNTVTMVSIFFNIVTIVSISQQHCHIYVNIYILLHGYFCIDLSMCPVNMYFLEGPRPKGQYCLQGTHEGQYKNNCHNVFII